LSASIGAYRLWTTLLNWNCWGYENIVAAPATIAAAYIGSGDPNVRRSVLKLLDFFRNSIFSLIQFRYHRTANINQEDSDILLIVVNLD